MEFNLSGKISFDDYIQFNKAYQRHGIKKIIRPILYIVLIIVIFYTFAPNVETFKELYKISPLSFLKFMIPITLVIIGLILFFTIGIKLIYKRHYNANKALQQLQNTTINESCVTIKTEISNGSFTKETINKIIYDKDSIYIFVGLNIGYILKKRFLENEDNFEELVKFVKSNYGKNK